MLKHEIFQLHLILGKNSMVCTAGLGVFGRISNICAILMPRKDRKCKYNFQVPQINSAPQGLSLFTWTWFLAHCILQILPESYTKYYVCLLYLSFMPYFLVCLQVHPHSSCKSSKCSCHTQFYISPTCVKWGQEILGESCHYCSRKQCWLGQCWPTWGHQYRRWANIGPFNIAV